MISTVAPSISQQFFLRDAKMPDIKDICELGGLLNTINLPAHKAELEKVISLSEQSFSLQNTDATARVFLFVLENQERKVIGTSQIFAKHGTLDSPHFYFEVKSDERYSKTLNKYFRHRTLRLCQSFDGPSEVGGLVLHPEYRSLPGRLGRNLSYVRFLFAAMQPDLFSQRFLAELLPPLGPNFESALWEGIGRKFTGIDYYEADMLSRDNKEFIKTLFPSGEIYVTLLPPDAQDVIGQVGRNSKGAAQLLSKIGFRYSHRVDPFDGGPHFEAEHSDISLLNEAMHGHVKASTSSELNNGFEAMREGLAGRFDPGQPSGRRFLATVSTYRYDQDAKQLILPSNIVDAIGARPGEMASVIDL